MKKSDDMRYMCLNTKIAFYVYTPLIVVALCVYLWAIVYGLLTEYNIGKCLFHLMWFFIGIFVNVQLIFAIPEYYIFEKDRIVVRSIMRIKKVVKKDEIKSIYWQDTTGRLALRKLHYYVIDDRSSNTLQHSEYRVSSNLDLMRIPIDKKSKTIIEALWPHEIQESHFPERK